MSDAVIPTPVGADELLARFILFSRWFRPSDKTTKQDAFIPFPYPDLSVSRHLGIIEAELWKLGEEVTSNISKATLYGRADLSAVVVRGQKLNIEPTPEPKNHANIVGWPPDKPGQKIIALQLAAASVFVSRQI